MATLTKKQAEELGLNNVIFHGRKPLEEMPKYYAMADAMLALEQTVDTVLPEFYFYDKFKPFAEDILPGIVAGKRFFAAHPAGEKPCPVDLQEPSVLTVGPEGGFTDYETEVWQAAGAELVTMGPRILRSEVAVPALIGRLYPGR